MSDNSNHNSNKVALNELIRRRRDLLFEIGEDEKALARKREIVFHMTETIKAIDPDVRFDAIPARHHRGTKSIWFAHGEITGFVYDAGRESTDRTFTSNEVAALAMRAKNLDAATKPEIFKDFENRIRLQLNALRRQEIVAKLEGRGRVAKWQLLRD